MDKNVVVPQETPYTKTNFASLSKIDAKVDGLGVETLDIENIPPPASLDVAVKKVPVPSDTTSSVKEIGKEALVAEKPLPSVNLTEFRVYTQEELEKMDIQKLLMTLLQCCYLVQHKNKRLNAELISTLQVTLDVVVKRLAEQQVSTKWAFPQFLAIGLNGASAFMGSYAKVAEAVGGATNIAGEMKKVTEQALITPLSAEQSQLSSSLQSYRERKISENQEEEKTLSNLERTLSSIYELCMKMF